MSIPRRITKETQNLANEPPPGIVAVPVPENYRHFDILINGPEGTPYEGGTYKLELFLPEQYPMEPPKDKLGRICLDILKDKWSPALQIRTVLLSIQALLSSPEPDDPLDSKVAEHFKQDKNDAENVAREWNRIYANNTAL
ncbi:hypothetical protein MKS88_003125 [Plasmodium brasilianum]|uniref:Uncharacterized protein n=1 Tax=Plasmodium brasilianum TaxID=5824 RepID=A0ACB9Y8G9_PLABR|nr:hypothetical protein MKS88_003125 [Plasmodium brasilianum]